MLFPLGTSWIFKLLVEEVGIALHDDRMEAGGGGGTIEEVKKF